MARCNPSGLRLRPTAPALYSGQPGAGGSGRRFLQAWRGFWSANADFAPRVRLALPDNGPARRLPQRGPDIIVEPAQPDIFDLAGAVLCLTGGAVILLAPRQASACFQAASCPDPVHGLDWGHDAT